MKNDRPPRLKKRYFIDLKVVQWAVPLLLGISAFLMEILEHTLSGELELDPYFISEIIIFSVIGPAVVAFIIVWMRDLMDAEQQANVEINLLNQELEAKVAERTATLQERNVELAQANHELEQLDEMKSEFVSLVSHELRAPLTTLNGGLEMAMQNADTLPEQARRILETMMYETTRLTSLVQTILDVTRLEAGRLEITVGPVALRPLMDHATSVILGSSSRLLRWSFSPDLPPVLADEIHLEEILRNIIRNADKYSPPDTPIHLCATQEGSCIRISVKDHGPGIPKDLQNYVFDRFMRGQSGENAPPGWGLGLYFAKKLIEAQHGTIGLVSPVWQNEEAPGTEFFILLPVDELRED